MTRSRVSRVACPIVKALVLSGGAGTRLRPITHTNAKQLVPLANKPILFYGLESIAAAGIEEVGIVVGSTHEAIRDAVGTGEAFGLRVTYIPQDEPLGLAHAVLIARDFLGDEPFVMYLGDNLIVGGITPFVEEFQELTPNALVLLTKVDEPQHFGVAELDTEGHLVRLVEKPEDPPSQLALVGLYLFDHHIHEAVRAIEPSARGELEITDAIQWLIESGRLVLPHTLETPWIDTGKLQDLLEANRIVLESLVARTDGSVDAASRVSGRVVIESGAEIVGSEVRGPAVIGTGTRIVDSYVGPFSSIATDCVLERAAIEQSVVLDRVEIRDVGPIRDSLIGRDARVGRSESMPGGHRLLIGDHSEISVS